MQPFSQVQRAMLEKHRAWGESKGISRDKIRPQILKLYARLTASQESYVFNTQFDTPSILPTENRLKRDSMMFVNLVGLAIHKVPVFSGVSYPQNFPLVFYPDKNIFADAAAAPGVVPENQCLEALYNGKLDFRTNSIVRLEDYPTNIFRQVPDTQNGAAAYPSQDLGLVDMSTSFLLNGNTDNRFTLNIGSGDRNGITGGAESINYACLLLAGFEVVEGSKSKLRIEEWEAAAR